MPNRTSIDGAEIQQLKALVAEQQRRLDALEGRSGNGSGGAEAAPRQKATRRDLLKMAGASLAGAAGVAAMRAVPASAATGSIMYAGTYNTATSTTAMVGYTAIGFAAITTQGGYGLFGVSNNGYGFGVLAKSGAHGYGSVSSAGTYGVGAKAYGGAIGVYGSSPAIGVRGTSTNLGTGVQGLGDWGALGTGSNAAGNAIGVYGYTTSSSSRAVYGYTSGTSSTAVSAVSRNWIGVGAAGVIGGISKGTGVGLMAYGAGTASGLAAQSVSGPDVKLFGTGRLVQTYNVALSKGLAVAPNFTPAAGYFEMVRGQDGAMWASRPTGTLQAAWKRVNAVRVDAADGSGNSFKPLRLIDTRMATMPYGQATLGPAAANTIRDYIAAGEGPGLQAIPSDAVAVFGNLTAIGGGQGGFMSIHPAGAGYNPATDPATFNFNSSGVTSNGFFCGLGTGANAGKIEVFIGGNGTHKANFIIDITGYVH